MLKITKINGLLACVLMYQSTTAFAYDGVIAFTGTVVASTCQLNLNSNAMSPTTSVTVAMDTISVISLGSTAGTLGGANKPLTFTTSGCGTTAAPAKLQVVYLSPTGGAVTNGTNYVPNSNTTAPTTNAGIALLADGTKVASGSSLNFTTGPNPSVSLAAQYVSTSATNTPGAYTGTVQLTMIY